MPDGHPLWRAQLGPCRGDQFNYSTGSTRSNDCAGVCAAASCCSSLNEMVQMLRGCPYICLIQSPRLKWILLLQ